MTRRHVGHVAVALLVIISVLGAIPVEVGFVNVVQAALATVLVLVLPGILIAKVLFPARSLGLPERSLLVIGVSLAVMSLGGQLLNFIPAGIRATPWFAMIALLVAGVLMIDRMQRHEPRAGLVGDLPAMERLHRMRPIVWFVPAAVVLALALVVSRIGIQGPTDEGFTQLWLVPVSSDARAVELGVQSSEREGAEYLLELIVAGDVEQQWPSIILSPSEEWHTLVSLSPDLADQEVEARLYLADHPDEPYRRVSLEPQDDPA